MALFNIRLPRFKASTEAIAPAPTESIEAMRRRARHRLIGATVLVLGVTAQNINCLHVLPAVATDGARFAAEMAAARAQPLVDGGADA